MHATMFRLFSTTVLIVFWLFSLLALPATPAAAQVFPGVAHWGVVKAGNEASFSFADPFDAPPIVLVSAQRGGVAVIASVVNSWDSGFNIFVTDNNGEPLDWAWVQWIAVQPDPANGIAAGFLTITRGTRVAFDQAFSTSPIVITNAWYADQPLVSWTTDTDSSGFTVNVFDALGQPATTPAYVYWLAVVPSQANGFAGGIGSYSHGDDISFLPPFATGPAYLVAAPGGLRAAAVDNRPDGFWVSLIDTTGQPTSSVEVQWLGYAGSPSTGNETDEDAAGLRITKIDSATDQPLAGACFTAWTDAGNGQPGTAGPTVCDGDDPQGNDGIINFTGIAAGNWVLVEKFIAPSGYQLADPVTVTLPAGETTEITIANDPVAGNATWYIGGEFIAETQAGPGAGTIVQGHLSLGVADDGSIAHGTLVIDASTSLTVTGQVSGSAVDLIIVAEDGRLYYLTGVATGPLENGAGSAGGLVSGPDSRDIGFWRLERITRETSCGPMPCPV